MADRDYSPDEWSDHDFFLISQPGEQEELRQDLRWLPAHERIAFSFRETEHGLKVLYDDGHMLEFAVFDVDEIALAGVNRYRVAPRSRRRRGGVRRTCATTRGRSTTTITSSGWSLTAALVAMGRGRRGEVLSAAFLVTWGLTYLTRLLARVVPAENASILDNFDPLRRFERAYPALGEELAVAVRLAPPEGCAPPARRARARAASAASRPRVGRVRCGCRAGSEAVVLEEAQPDLAARREARHRVPQRVDRHLARRPRSSPRAATRRRRRRRTSRRRARAAARRRRGVTCPARSARRSCRRPSPTSRSRPRERRGRPPAPRRACGRRRRPAAP